MKVNIHGWEIQNESIQRVIEKLAEADGSAVSQLSYLIDASKLLAESIAEIAEEIGNIREAKAHEE